MKLNDLLIIDIGRSFLFSTHLKFDKTKGYKVNKLNYSRYPEFYELDGLIKEYIVVSGNTDSDVLCILNNNKVKISEIKHDTVKRSPKYWNDNLTKLQKSIDINKIAYIDFSYEKIGYVKNGESSEVEFDIFNWEFLSNNHDILEKIGISYNQMINYFVKQQPLPQQVTDHHKSFILGYLFGEYIFEKFDISNVEYLVISSEYFKSGFFDKSGVLEYLVHNQLGIKKISFDIEGIWSLVLNDSLDKYSHLKFVNREVFYPEFNLIHDSPKKINHIDDEEIKEVYLLKQYQSFIDKKGDYEVQFDQKSFGIENSVYFKSDLSLRRIFDFDYFVEWYKFYNYQRQEYISMKFKDSNKHFIDVEDSFISKINSDQKTFTYDVFTQSNNINNVKISVVQGEIIKKGVTIAKSEKFGGILFNEIKSQFDSKVKFVDTKKGWVVTTLEYSNLKENAFSYRFVKHITKNIARIEIEGFRLDCSIIYGKKILGVLDKYNNDLNKIKQESIICCENFLEAKNVIDNFTKLQPKGIILPNTELSHIKGLLGLNARNLDVLTIILLNGFGSSQMGNYQRKFINYNMGKSLVVDPSELSIYTVEEKGKFSSESIPTSFFPRSSVYTFDDWNFYGNLIYNDKDSQIFKSENGRVFDVAEFNVLDYNYE